MNDLFNIDDLTAPIEELEELCDLAGLDEVEGDDRHFAHYDEVLEF